MVRGQQAVQVVQQVNQAGQVVHQVLQTVPQSPSPQASPVAPLSALGELLPLSACANSRVSVPTSIASKLPTAPLARPDLPTSSTASPGQTSSGAKTGENQQEAISAIVQSLMMAETQLKLEEQRKAGPVLPTVPVPAASLTARTVQQGGSRVVSRASLPTYSQAISHSAPPTGSLQTSPSTLRRSSDSPAQPSPGTQPALASPGEAATGGTLSALLADTPAADKPLPGTSSGLGGVSGNSLLERLVSGGHQGNSSSATSILSPAASQLPPVQSNGGSEEITLQSLLSGPAKVQSPNKVSPLLQQLQQPVQSYPQSLTSPRHPPPSPRPVTSPRQVTPPSPSRATPSMSALQHQLMQPPAPRYPGPAVSAGPAGAATTHSILSAQLTAPPRNTNTGHQAANGNNTVQLVSQTGQQLQLVNHHVNNVQLVNSPSQPAVQLLNQQGLQQVQLVNQVAGAGVGVPGGQQIMVNNVPMQLSLSHPVQFSVNLGETTANSIATIANGATQTPILVSGAGQPGNCHLSHSLSTNCDTSGAVTVTSMANIGKLVSNGPNGAPTVLLQSQAGNILLPGGVKQGGAGQAGMVRQGQVMVRQGQQSPVLVQLPSGDCHVSDATDFNN